MSFMISGSPRMFGEEPQEYFPQNTASEDTCQLKRSISTVSQLPNISHKTHQRNQDSLSSVNTNATLVEEFQSPCKTASRTDSVSSNDTLFEASKQDYQRHHRSTKSDIPSSTRPPHSSTASIPLSAMEQTHFQQAAPPVILTHSPDTGFMSMLKKHPTSDFKNSTPRFKDSYYDLPAECRFLSCQESCPYVKSSLEEICEDGLPNVLLVDVRPFPDYCKSHIKGAVNVCLPSTLLKRPAFSLERCIATLTSDEKMVFTRFMERGPSGQFPTLLLYDSNTVTRSAASLSVSKLASKFVAFEGWDSPIIVMKGGFRDFEKQYPNLLESGSPSLFPGIGMSVETAMDHLRVGADSTMSSSPSPSPSSATPKTPKRAFRSAVVEPLQPRIPYKKSTSSGEIHTLDRIRIPCLSRFVLPDPPESPFFKTRHHEELLTPQADHSHQLSTEAPSQEYPEWLSRIIGSDRGATTLSAKFHNLQVQERERLTKVLSRRTNSDDETPVISSGVELGRKNRYKDIIPYEHSRVRLCGTCNSSEADYINASYLSAPGSSNRYIATQGPLLETIGDFWRVVVNHNTCLVLSLTPQKENEVEKCAPYWEPGLYKSDGMDVVVTELEETSDLKLHDDSVCTVVFRRLKIMVEGLTEGHEVLQVHILSWPDYGAMINSKDLLSIVALKRFISAEVANSPVVVHCSAGCGRTGVLCAIDTAVDILMSTDGSRDADTEFDPIFDTVRSFRNQRISMVQNLRQYMLIYDAIIHFFKIQHGAQHAELSDTFHWESNDAIIRRFVEDFHNR